MTWSANQYVTFEDERTRPVRDLLAAIPRRDVHTAVDLGCGPGNSTQVLAARFPGAKVTGLDNSENMIFAARKRLPSIQFDVVDIQDWDTPELFDVILANASLQWVPDHATLYPRLVSKLSPGGVLAVQTPDNFDEPAHRLMRDVASAGPWAGKLAAVSLLARENANWYFKLLQPHCARIDIWRTIYYHQLKGGATDVVEWFKGSALRPFLEALDADEQAQFLERYKALLQKAYSALPDGMVLLPFPRLFIIATR